MVFFKNASHLLAVFLVVSLFFSVGVLAQEDAGDDSNQTQENQTVSVTPTLALSALTANETILLYAREEDSASFSTFESDGTTYYLGLFNAKESIVLVEQGEEFVPVEDNETLNLILPSYISGAYADFFLGSNIDDLKTAFEALSKTFDYCDEVLTPFLNNGFMLFYIRQTDDRGTPVPLTDNALVRLDGNTSGNSSEKGTSNVLIEDFQEASVKVNEIDYSASASEVRAKLTELNDLIEEMKGVSDEYSTDFNFLRSRHPDMLSKRVCGLTSESFSDVSTEIGVKDSVPTVSSLAQTIFAETKTRKTLREVNEIYSRAEQKHAYASGLLSSVKNRLNKTQISLAGFERKVADLESNLSLVKAAENVEAAKALEEIFDNNYVLTKDWLEALNNTSLGADIVESGLAVKESKEAVYNASLLLGENNERVIELKEKRQTVDDQLKTELRVIEKADGSLVPAAVFQNITLTANSITEQARSLQPAWNLSFSNLGDLAIIVGAIVIVALIVGLVIYYRSQKTLLNVSTKMHEAHEREVDIRKFKK